MKKIILGTIIGIIIFTLFLGGTLALTEFVSDYYSKTTLEEKYDYIETQLPIADVTDYGTVTSEKEFLENEFRNIAGELCLERLDKLKEELCEKDNTYSWCK